MRIRSLARAAVIVVAASLLMAASPELTVYYFHRPPLYIQNDDGSAGGFLTDIVRLVLDEAKLPYRLVERPSARVEASLMAGEFACGIGWYKRADREAWATFSDPIYVDRPLVILANEKAARELGPKPGIETILRSGLILGVIESFAYGAFADKAIERYRPMTEKVAGSQALLVGMIARGRADYMFMGLEEASYIVASDPELARKLHILSVADAPGGQRRYIMFSKAVDKAVVSRVNAAIAVVVGSPAYKRASDYSRYLTKPAP